MIRRNQKLVLRYYKPNRQLYPEKFAYHVLLLFYPFINESDLFSKDGVYSSKLLEPLVSATVNQTRQIFEPNSELTDSFRFSDSEQGRLRNLYSEVLVNLIDKISMVSNIRLSHIHKRLCEIFDGSESQPFANLSILAVGDLLQVATNYLVVICNGRID